MTDGSERRVHERIPLKMLVQFRLHDMEEFMREYAANISAGGMFIRTRQPHPEGSNVYFQFRLADEGKVFGGLGKVVHVNPPDHAVPGMGIEFINLDRPSRDIIDEIIKARVAELGEVEDSEG